MCRHVLQVLGRTLLCAREGATCSMLQGCKGARNPLQWVWLIHNDELQCCVRQAVLKKSTSFELRMTPRMVVTSGVKAQRVCTVQCKRPSTGTTDT